MKISSYHKAQGDSVSWYTPIEHSLFDKVYAASVFTWSDKSYVRPDMICGGTGFDVTTTLPQAIEEHSPDYSIYPDFNAALGFITRGCIRKCAFCFVPEKEGYIRPGKDVEHIAGDRKELVLLDNNFLAGGYYAHEQAEKIIRNRYKVDFNQGLDARLIDDDWAATLAKFKWMKPLRMACDHDSMLDIVIQAAERLRKHNCTPKAFSVYVLVTDLASAHRRVTELAKHGLDPFAQPLRDKNGNVPSWDARQFARWVNRKEYFYGVSWEEFIKIQRDGYRKRQSA